MALPLSRLLPRPRVLCGVLLCAAALVGASQAPRSAPVPVALDLLKRPAAATSHGERRLLTQMARAGSAWLAVGDGGLILRSDDAAPGSWHQSSVPVSVMLTAVCFASARRGWAVGHDGVILATLDGGLSWRHQFDGRDGNPQVLAAARRRLEVLQARTGRDAATQSQLEQAENRLADAEAAMRAGASQPLLAVAFIDATTGYAAGSFGQLFETRDGGQQWRYIGDRLPNPDGLHLNSITVQAGGELWIAAEAGKVFRSRDGGQHWQVFDTGYAGYLYGVVALDDVRVAYGFNGHVFRSTDGGEHWQQAQVPLRKPLVHAEASPSGLWLMAQDGTLLGSVDAGRTFAVLKRLEGDTLSHFLVANERVVAVGLNGLSVAQMQKAKP